MPVLSRPDSVRFDYSFKSCPRRIVIEIRVLRLECGAANHNINRRHLVRHAQNFLYSYSFDFIKAGVIATPIIDLGRPRTLVVCLTAALSSVPPFFRKAVIPIALKL
jgi:hypothetical protein